MKISKKNIQIYLADQKMSMKQLAAKIDMMPQNLSAVLNRGSCNPTTAARIAEGLGVDVTAIMKEES